MSLYFDFFMQNLVRAVYEEILLLSTATFRGNYTDWGEQVKATRKGTLLFRV